MNAMDNEGSNRLKEVNARINQLHAQIYPLQIQVNELEGELEYWYAEKQSIERGELVLHRIIDGDHEWKFSFNPHTQEITLCEVAYVLWSSLDEERQTVEIRRDNGESSLRIISFPIRFVGDRING